ncbi:RNA-directed DNA polymerase, eukaryota, Reverse transcriptase zinc-binding domain protein [Artemisia annua]|uniref:RNA-directed DNA polymerase, eukaryota, Reverse transcriptase zinc-binding domain protein n=1 Tax=Artemisia annua TaxID=35608 RepID=A0A2U1M2Z7_ARTAN|nr:RNA-directed DNA polymerase, eukaryota, Reverse transcriptase zinc-binding domain protein [Artemisia annua]
MEKVDKVNVNVDEVGARLQRMKERGGESADASQPPRKAVRGTPNPNSFEAAATTFESYPSISFGESNIHSTMNPNSGSGSDHSNATGQAGMFTPNVVANLPEGDGTHVAPNAGKFMASPVTTTSGLVANEPSASIPVSDADQTTNVNVVTDVSKPVMHVQVNVKADNKAFFVSFVYAHNYYTDRRVLWHELEVHGSLMRDKPWVLLGDFNASLFLEDKSGRGYEPTIAMNEFKDCVNNIEVSDLNSSGLHFTWNRKPKGSNGVLKKLDRVMGNVKFSDDFPGSFAIFQPYRISDHSHCVLRIPTLTKKKPKPFKFFNFLTYKPGFSDVVRGGWSNDIQGHNMFKVVKRLKVLKSPICKLLRDQGLSFVGYFMLEQGWLVGV